MPVLYLIAQWVFVSNIHCSKQTLWGHDIKKVRSEILTRRLVYQQKAFVFDRE